MAKPTRRKKESKLAVALLSPILVLMFIVGWSLYWIGQPRMKYQLKSINTTSSQQDDVELIVIPPIEEQILAK